MRPRHWLLLSIILYGIALAQPALQSVKPEASENPMFGWQCFVSGLLYSFIVWPLVAWAPNAWLGVLWVRTWRNLPTKPLAWLSVAWAVGALVVLYYTLQVGPREGAGFWIASIAVGVVAARQASDRARVPTREAPTEP